MLDHDLEKLIQENPDLQVLEIACGLSPRGWWFRQHYPSISYRERFARYGSNKTKCTTTN